MGSGNALVLLGDKNISVVIVDSRGANLKFRTGEAFVVLFVLHEEKILPGEYVSKTM